MKRTVLNELSSCGKGSVDKADTQHTHAISTSEHQMAVPLKEALPCGETVDLNASSSSDKGSVNNAETRSVESVGDSGCLKSRTSEYYCSVKRWQLERADDDAGADTVTVLQGAFMEFGVNKLATPQETLLLHTICKAMVSLIENQSTSDERQKLLEAVLDIPDERLMDF